MYTCVSIHTYILLKRKLYVYNIYSSFIYSHIFFHYIYNFLLKRREEILGRGPWKRPHMEEMVWSIGKGLALPLQMKERVQS